MFDTYVSCILNYGCEIWGTHKGDDLEKVHLNFLKRILKVRKSTTNYMVYFELGRFPLYIDRYCRMLKYWLKILESDNCILKNCYDVLYESSLKKQNDNMNWTCKIKDILFRYGFQDVWLRQNVLNIDHFICEFKHRVRDSFITEAISYFDMSSKCNFYRFIHDNHCLQFYLSRPINYMFKPIICKYRIHAHSLNVETGRYCNIDRNDRLCEKCDELALEDEFHFILCCKKYEEIRKRYIKPYYWHRPSAFKLVQLLSVRNIKQLNNLGKYLINAEKLRNN